MFQNERVKHFGETEYFSCKVFMSYVTVLTSQTSRKHIYKKTIMNFSSVRIGKSTKH